VFGTHLTRNLPLTADRRGGKVMYSYFLQCRNESFYIIQDFDQFGNNLLEFAINFSFLPSQHIFLLEMTVALKIVVF
jgi:hypothetical protein